MAAFMERWNGRVKGCRERHGVVGWDQRFMERKFAWGGHVARMGKYDCKRLTYRVLKYKNLDWIRARTRREGGQGHGRRLRTWTWERCLSKGCKALYGAKNWEEVTADKDDWEKAVKELAAWRTTHY